MKSVKWGYVFRSLTTLISSNNSWQRLLFFRTKKDRLFEEGDYFEYCSLEVVP